MISAIACRRCRLILSHATPPAQWYIYAQPQCMEGVGGGGGEGMPQLYNSNCEIKTFKAKRSR